MAARSWSPTRFARSSRRSSRTGISLRGLGSHRLKDLREPQPLCQVVADGLRMEFPPLRSLDARPEQPADAADLVRRAGARARRGRGAPGRANRLVTLTGPGGTGQDTALPPGRRERGGGLPGRRVLRRARDGPRARAWWRPGSRRRSGSRRPGPAAPTCVLREWLGGQARPARARQLRAGARRRSDRRGAPAGRTGPVCARDVARATPRVRRAGVPGAGPADAARSVAAVLDGACEPARGEPRSIDVEALSAYESVRLFIARAHVGEAGLPGHERERAGGRGDRREAARHAPGDRARRGADQAVLARRAPRAAGGPARAPVGRGARPAGTAADAPRRDRLELRHARRRAWPTARSAVGVRGRHRPRRGGGRLRADVGARHGRGRWPGVPR